MISFYVKRIIAGKKKWTEVPILWIESVKDELINQGYILNNDGTVTKED